jgi:hypothetical protein
MAHQNLTLLSHPDIFIAAIHQMVERIAAKPVLGQCWYEDEYCDCRKPATVHMLDTDFEYCARHFEAVTRG